MVGGLALALATRLRGRQWLEGVDNHETKRSLARRTPMHLANDYIHPTASRDVLKPAIKSWRLFKEIEPSHRFQTRYSNHRRHDQRHRQ